MNLYTFKTRHQAMDAFLDWVTVNAGMRFRTVGRNRLITWQPPKSFRRRRGFHSEVQCGIRRLSLSTAGYRKAGTGGWSYCNFHGQAFRRPHIFLTRDLLPPRRGRRWDLKFPTRFAKLPKHNRWSAFGITPPNVSQLEIISILFDSAADMILCKMRWHDERDE